MSVFPVALDLAHEVFHDEWGLRFLLVIQDWHGRPGADNLLRIWRCSHIFAIQMAREHEQDRDAFTDHYNAAHAVAISLITLTVPSGSTSSIRHHGQGIYLLSFAES